MTRPTIVITGMGALCSLGGDAATIWSAMKQGHCGIGPLSIPDQGDLKTPIAAQIPVLPDHGLDRRQMAAMSDFALYAVIAAREALDQAGLAQREFDPHRIGAVIGTGVYGGDAVEHSYRSVFLEGKKRTELFTVPKAMPSAPVMQVSMVHGIKGPVLGVTSACSSANHAVAMALDMLRAGRADIMLAGGSDAPLTYGVLKAWESMRILAKTGCRPFSADREGLVLGDGAGVVVLETEEHARARGATPLAELAGAGMSADAGDLVAPDLDGAMRAMTDCLADADLAASDIGYVNAHGTATLGNDRTETRAIRAVFGGHADALAISSTKSMHGHCLGASGALELVAMVGALRDGVLPPTINLTVPDPECDLDYVANAPREAKISAAISNAFAFGGANAVIAVKAA